MEICFEDFFKIIIRPIRQSKTATIKIIVRIKSNCVKKSPNFLCHERKVVALGVK